MKFKKSQIQSQIFIYVFALLVISLILFFGIKSLSSFKKDTEKVILVNFVTELKSKISSITSEYDSVSEVSLDLPKDYEAVCFKSSKIYDSTTLFSGTHYDSILNEYITTDNNVFIMKKGGLLESEFNAGKIQVPSNTPFCIDNNLGTIKFRVRGKGRYAEISNLP